MVAGCTRGGKRYLPPACRAAALPGLGAALALVLVCIPSLAGEGSPLVPASGECVEVAPQPDSDSFRFLPSPDHEALAESIPANTRIGAITVRRFKVFDMDDPKESGRIYRWANDFHSVTREWVVRDHLLVEEGDEFNIARVRESERLLRELKFIYDASVRPSRWCGDRVDLEVITRDIWTFTPVLSFNLAGGSSDYDIGFRDTNFLGTGKQVGIRYESDEERSGTNFVYADPSLLGSRWRLRLSWTENDDGYDRHLRLNRPFYSIYEKWSAGTAILQQELEEKVWFRGDEVAEFDHEIDRFRLHGGIATQTRADRQVGRWLFGYAYADHEFSFSDSDIPPPALPEDREQSYPFIGYHSIEDEFVELRNINYLGRTEDVYVGETYRWALGWSGEAIGASRDQLALEGTYSNTLKVEDNQLWVVDTSLTGFWNIDDEDFENLWWTTETRYHLRQSEKWALFGALRVDYTDGLTLDNQLTLGGSNGLRGYDRNYQVGDRAYLFNIEQRYYSDWHPFRLLRVGYAAFIDVGRAWFQGEDNGSNGDVLANAGIGLRLNSSRAEKGSVIHIDLAVPFMDDDDVDDYQFLIRVRDRF